jgi:hypothetical protein
MFLLAAAAAAQNHLYLPASLSPDTSELAHYSLRPFMQTNSRVQMFFDATEAGAATFTATGLALRWDGPVPQVGASGPFAIQRLQIRVGATAVALPGAPFAGNQTQPLTTVFDGPWSYLPDPGMAAPHPWGAPGTSLTFPFLAPATVTIPPGGWFVVEVAMQGNNIASFGFSHALADGARVGGGPVEGTAVNYGQGCSAATGAAAARIGTTGMHAPGAAHFVNGQNLGANSFVLAIAGLSNTQSSLGALPLTVPGTSCQFLTSIDLTWLLQADAAGSIAPDQDPAALIVPPNPVFAGFVLYEQLLAFVPGANPPWGFALSDARAVTLGGLSAPGIGAYTVSHGSRHDARIADKVEAFGFALRLTLQ